MYLYVQYEYKYMTRGQRAFMGMEGTQHLDSKTETYLQYLGTLYR